MKDPIARCVTAPRLRAGEAAVVVVVIIVAAVLTAFGQALAQTLLLLGGAGLVAIVIVRLLVGSWPTPLHRAGLVALAPAQARGVACGVA